MSDAVTQKLAVGAPADSAETPVPHPDPRALLSKFIEDEGTSPTAIAAWLEISHTAVFSWLDAEHPRTPSHPYRLAIERMTGGLVPASAWETDAEKGIYMRVLPFPRRERSIVADTHSAAA